MLIRWLLHRIMGSNPRTWVEVLGGTCGVGDNRVNKVLDTNYCFHLIRMLDSRVSQSHTISQKEEIANLNHTGYEYFSKYIVSVLKSSLVVSLFNMCEK